MQSSSSKRARTEALQVDPAERRYVYLLGIDDLVNLVYGDMTLLRHYGCRTQRQVDNGDAPYYVENDGVPVYIVWMKRHMLVCFLTSLTAGKMCLESGTSYSQATAMFDYEGICVPDADDAADYAKVAYAIDGQKMGVGMNKRSESLLDTAMRVSEKIASAIVEWPRLEHGLESAFGDDEAPEKTSVVTFSCTPTRCWVRFAQPPVTGTLLEDGADPTYEMCKKRPYWLLATLYAIGSVYTRLVTLDRIKRDDRSEAAFFALENGIKHDPSHHFLSTRIDVPRAWRERAKKDLGEAERFAIMVLNEVTGHGELKESDKVGNACKYSRACVALALKMATTTPKIAKMFAGGCEDDKGVTPERFALTRALRAHGIKVVKWGNDEKALVFPPAFRGLDPKAEGPCVLLGFEQMR